MSDDYLSSPHVYENARAATTELVNICHGLSRRSGWWSNDADLTRLIALAEENGLSATMDKLLGLKKVVRLMLIVSELGEAMEAHRKDLNDDHLPHFKGIAVELADALIRITDMAGGDGLPLADAVAEKLAYNQNRADHKPENRAQPGGKAF